MADETNSLFDQIITALGGTGAAAKALGRSSSQICQWRAKDQRFPAEMFFVVDAALKQRNNETLLCPHCGGVIVPTKARRLKKPKSDLPHELPRELFRFEDERRAG